MAGARPQRAAEAEETVEERPRLAEGEGEGEGAHADSASAKTIDVPIAILRSTRAVVIIETQS